MQAAKLMDKYGYYLIAYSQTNSLAEEHSYMEDIDLVRECLERDNAAWSIFWQRFQRVIAIRIRQVFARYNYRAGESQFYEAFDYVFDHFFSNKALAGYRKSGSLDGYVATVAARATIDWYRASVTEKQLYGQGDKAVRDQYARATIDWCRASVTGKQLYGQGDEALRDQYLPEQEDPSDGSGDTLEQRAKFSTEERLCYRIMLISFRDLESSDLNELAKLANKSESVTRKLIEALQTRLMDKNQKADDHSGKLQVLFLQIQVLERKKGQAERLAKKRQQLSALQEQYKKQGFEVFPSRTDLTELFNWDINKTDRLLRKVKEKLRLALSGDGSAEP